MPRFRAPRWSLFAAAAVLLAACAGSPNEKTGDPQNATSCTSPTDETSPSSCSDSSGQTSTTPARDAGAGGSSGSSGAPAADSGAACNATTCALGCCAAGRCYTDHGNDHCATGGVACPAACAPGDACQAQGRSYACTPTVKADQKYDVVLVSVLVSATADVYVNDGISAFASLAIPRTDTQNSSTLATWNKDIGQLRGDQIVGKNVTVEVKDDRAFRPDRLIGTCNHVVTQAEVLAGAVDIKPPDCDGEVLDARFDVKPVQ